jgi:hypothetical protein
MATKQTTSFNLENVPGVLNSCEMHGKRAKRSANPDAAPTREKRIDLTLDVTDGKFAPVLERCWPGSDLLIKGMAGAKSAAQDLVSRARMGELSLKVFSGDGATKVFDIQVAKPLGRPTLRIGKAAEKVLLNVRVVGPIASDLLRTIDDHCEADVYVSIAVAQTDLEDHVSAHTIDGEIVEDGNGQALAKPPVKTTRRGKTNGTQVEVSFDEAIV